MLNLKIINLMRTKNVFGALAVRPDGFMKLALENFEDY